MLSRVAERLDDTVDPLGLRGDVAHPVVGVLGRQAKLDDFVAVSQFLIVARRGDHASALRWIAEARKRCIRKTDIWAGMLGAVLLTEAELRFEAGDLPGTDAAARELVTFAARTYLDALLPRGVAILSERSKDDPPGAFA